MTTPDELDKLLADILEGEANEEQLTRFDELVLEHPELLQRCQEHLRMQSALVGMGNSQSDNDFVETVTAHAASITAEDEGAFLSTQYLAHFI